MARDYLGVAFLLLLSMANFTSAADELKPRVRLFRSVEQKLTPEVCLTLQIWSEKLLESANYNIQPPVIEVQDRYRECIRGDYLVISYGKPVTLKVQDGEVATSEIIVCLSRTSEFAWDLFTVGPDGKVEAHGKYWPIAIPMEARAAPSATNP